MLLAAYEYRFARDTDALTRHLIDTDAIAWDYLGDDLLGGAPDDLRTALNPNSVGPSRLTNSARVITSDGSPPQRMVFDESSAPDHLEWAYVLRPEGIEVIALTQDTRGPVVGWDSGPLASCSDEPQLWRPDVPPPLTVVGPKVPGLTTTRLAAVGPPSARQPAPHR